jgi:hypothetical protein
MMRDLGVYTTLICVIIAEMLMILTVAPMILAAT